MASVRVHHQLDAAATKALLASPQGGVAKDLLRRGKKVESQAKRNLERSPRRVDTGLLRSSINTQLIALPGGLSVRVGTNVYYASWVHDGTGIYGPKGLPIRPTGASLLSWRPKGGKKKFAISVKGMKPNPFLADAMPAAKG